MSREQTSLGKLLPPTLQLSDSQVESGFQIDAVDDEDVIRVSLPGANNATTVVQVEANDEEQVRERVEDALRGILGGRTAADGSRPGSEGDLYELSAEIAEAVAGVAEQSGQDGGMVVTLRFEGGDGGNASVAADEDGFGVVISGLDSLPHGETSEIQGLKLLFDRNEVEYHFEIEPKMPKSCIFFLIKGQRV